MLNCNTSFNIPYYLILIFMTGHPNLLPLPLNNILTQPQAQPRKQRTVNEPQANSKKTVHSTPQAKVPQLVQETAKVNGKHHSPAGRQVSSVPATASAVKQEHDTAPHQQRAVSRDQSHKSDKPKVVVHSIHTSSTEQPNQVYQQLNPNAIGVTMQGPGTVDITTYQPHLTHDVVFDPNPPDPCPNNGCNAAKQGDKRHQK